MTESLTGLAEALHAEGAPVDAERVWRRVEAQIAVATHRREAKLRPFTPPVRRWGAVMATVMAVALAFFFVWRDMVPGVDPSIEFSPVPLNLSLWQPEAIADTSMGSATEELIALLEPAQP